MPSTINHQPSTLAGPQSSDPQLSTINHQPKSRLAYILAASHSGSTLLAMLLGAHPDLRTVGELKATSLGDAERYRCSCGVLLRKCEFWSRVSAGMAERGIQYDPANAGTSIHAVGNDYLQKLLRPLHRGSLFELIRDSALSLSPAWSRHLRDTSARNVALVETLLALTGARAIVDSSKNALRLKYLLQDPRIDIKVIRLIRDGRGVALTYVDPVSFADARDPALRAGGSGGHRDDEKKSMKDAAMEWKRSNEAAECLIKTLPRSQWIEVRYEELCRNHLETLTKICGFLDVNPDRIVRDFRSVTQHVIGNGMRLDRTSEISLDERWKTHLSADDLNTFDRIADNLNRRYGYL